MGITPAVGAIIAAVVAAGAGAGTTAYEAHAADVHAGEAKRDQAAAAGEAQNKLDQEKQTMEAQQAAAVSLARQRAVAALTPSTFGGTLGSGTSGQQNFAGKSLLGV